MAFPTTTNAYAGSLAITHHQAADGCQQGSTAQPKNTSQHPNKNGTPKQVVSARGINVLGQVLPSRQPFKEVGRLLKDTPRGLMGLFPNYDRQEIKQRAQDTLQLRSRHNKQSRQTQVQTKPDRQRGPPKHDTRHSDAHKDRGWNPITNSQPRTRWSRQCRWTHPRFADKQTVRHTNRLNK